MESTIVRHWDMKLEGYVSQLFFPLSFVKKPSIFVGFDEETILATAALRMLMLRQGQ